MAINATVFTPRTTQAKLSQANTSQVVRVTVPGPKGDTGAFGGSLGELNDVVITSPAAAAFIQYNSSEETWTDQIDIGALGNITLSGGTF